jgi:hypothetical protein
VLTLALSAATPLLAPACLSADGSQGEVEPLVNASAFELAAPPGDRGLLASAGFDGQPLKGAYFFPGDVSTLNQSLFTANPTLPEDSHWNTDPAARQSVLRRIAATHTNTLIMSYWGNDMQRWSPMQLIATSVPNTLADVSNQQLLVLPSLESGYELGTQYWRFSDDFPYKDGSASAANLAPTFLARLREVVALFRANMGPDMSHWARVYDRAGKPRYAVQVMHVYAHAVPQVANKTPDQVVAEAFDSIAAEIARTEGIDIGFLLDVIPGAAGEYSLTPAAGPALEAASSVLAIAGFISEIFSNTLSVSEPNAPPIDNNMSNLNALLDWKIQHIQSWVRTGVPVIYDVSSGYDGRFVWKSQGSFFWGDNFEYTFDAWRNALSAFKGLGTVGITFNTWNGYTEGFAAVPTVEHGDTINRWLTDLYAPDPRECSHVEYVNGMPGVQVQGPICAKWRELNASRGVLGAPMQAQSQSARGSVVHFALGSIFHAESVGAHAVYGAIHTLYKELGYDASCLGLPISDEEALPPADGRVVHFEGGDITFEAGVAQSRCD